MVPKKAGGGAARGESSAGKGQGRRRKATAKGKREQSEPAEPPAFIDPDLAMVIKHPLRAQIVALAHQRLISPSEFAEGTGISLSAASGHFKALSKVDFLELVEEVKVRRAVKHMYRATKDLSR